MANKLLRNGRTIGGRKIMANSLSLTGNELLSLSGGFLVKATSSTGAIIGMAAGATVATSNNQTVAKVQYDYIAKDDFTEYELTINGGTVTQTSVGNKFSLNANQEVDGTTAGTGTQLTLVTFISATKGIFRPL